MGWSMGAARTEGGGAFCTIGSKWPFSAQGQGGGGQGGGGVLCHTGMNSCNFYLHKGGSKGGRQTRAEAVLCKIVILGGIVELSLHEVRQEQHAFLPTLLSCVFFASGPGGHLSEFRYVTGGGMRWVYPAII